MSESDKLLTELKDIRDIMERSSRFLSLSGLSGILIGLYALIGAFMAYHIVYIQFPSHYRESYINDVLVQLFVIGATVLILSLITIFLLTIKKARKENKAIWGPGSKLLLLNLLIPLITGAILISTFTFRGYYGVISPAFLIFYGLALVNAAKYTRPEIMGLGIVEILLGLIAAIFPGYGLYLWAVGFGVVHIIYGAIYVRYESKQKSTVKNPILNLNKAFENKVRLGVMAALMVNLKLSFNELKDLLELTDGNLASHLKALEKAEYVLVNKSFIGRKPNTTYTITNSGKKAFELHLKALEELINQHK